MQEHGRVLLVAGDDADVGADHLAQLDPAPAASLVGDRTDLGVEPIRRAD